jgi:hypothetical protein
MVTNSFDGTITIGGQTFRASDVSIECSRDVVGIDDIRGERSFFPVQEREMKITVKGDYTGFPLLSSVQEDSDVPVSKSPLYPEQGRRRLCLEE